MIIKKAAIIGFGEVGAVLAADLAARNAVSIAAFDLKFADPQSQPSKMIANSSATCSRAAEVCVADADLVISAVTAASTLDAAKSTIGALKKNAWYFDLNSASPASKKTAAAIINGAGGRYIEASVMSPINPKGVETPVLLGGPYAREFEPIAQAFGFSGAVLYAEEPGKTAAAKLCRSVFVKGMEALVSESLLAAQYYGVEDEMLSSFNNLFAHPDWRGHAQYLISRTLEHGERRAEEMDEAARTVRDANVAPWMCEAISRRQRWAAHYSGALQAEDLSGLLSAIREHATENEKG